MSSDTSRKQNVVPATERSETVSSSFGQLIEIEQKRARKSRRGNMAQDHGFEIDVLHQGGGPLVNCWDPVAARVSAVDTITVSSMDPNGDGQPAAALATRPKTAAVRNGGFNCRVS